jgi:CRP/FNR family transcriptional regulator, cyclic AMP receptor protein
MARSVRTANTFCRLLEEDVELAEAVPSEHRGETSRECVSRVLAVPAGPWRTARAIALEECVGLLVLDGLLIRRVGVDGRFAAELLGAGDLLRPWQREEEPETLAVTASWRAIEPARVAVLDERLMRKLASYPQTTEQLLVRALRRARKLAVNMAIVHQARVDVRLHMLLWHLAGRWGRVRGDGVSLPLRLTHSVLAELAAARRPTVSSALSELARQNRVRQVADGWLLCGQPPGELRELAPVSAELLEAATGADAAAG